MGNERKADETYADELRHTIGNVAHDLKTVSWIYCIMFYRSIMANDLL